MKRKNFTTMWKKTAHLLSRNILSTAAVIALMWAAAFAAAPTGWYLPGTTLDPDCAPSDTDSVVQGWDMTDDTWSMSGSNVYTQGWKVGIWTDTPSMDLEVKNMTGSTWLRLVTNTWSQSFVDFTNSPTNRWAIWKYQDYGPWYAHNDGLFFYEDNTGVWWTKWTRMVIAKWGNVWIGTYNPSAPLDVNWDYPIMIAPSATWSVATISDSFMRIWYEDKWWAGSQLDIGIANESAKWYPTWLQARKPADYSQSRTIALNPNGGNVWIGTTAPSAKLEVVDWTSSLKFQDDLQDNLVLKWVNPTMSIEATSGNPWIALKLNGWTRGFIQSFNTTGKDWLWFAANWVNPQMFLTSAGNVWIWITDAKAVLHIAEDSVTAAELLRLNNTNTTGKQWFINFTGSNWTTYWDTKIYWWPIDTSWKSIFKVVWSNQSWTDQEMIYMDSDSYNSYIKLSTAGTWWNGSIERMRIDKDGNVWIWTTNPDSMLHIEWASWIKLSSWGYSAKEIVHTSHHLSFKVGWSEKMRIPNMNWNLSQIMWNESQANLPTFTFITDNNTWMGRLGGDKLGFSTNWVNRVTIQPTWEVNIWDLSWSYSWWSAYVCVDNDWTIYASETACP